MYTSGFSLLRHSTQNVTATRNCIDNYWKKQRKTAGLPARCNKGSWLLTFNYNIYDYITFKFKQNHVLQPNRTMEIVPDPFCQFLLECSFRKLINDSDVFAYFLQVVSLMEPKILKFRFTISEFTFLLLQWNQTFLVSSFVSLPFSCLSFCVIHSQSLIFTGPWWNESVDERLGNPPRCATSSLQW